MKFFYPAVFKKINDEKYKVHFPDLDQCFAEGRTFDEALENAKEAERNWISIELEENLDLPSKSELSDILHDEGDIVQNVSVSLRLMEGYDE
ncbi:MAG: type II toxin-antitoxin system HicB family antitoxin [Eubacteriales bacterium]|nr:type II toxin-antitoxin system HicB family antitoxin [Eubacteriales bacterium]